MPNLPDPELPLLPDLPDLPLRGPARPAPATPRAAAAPQPAPSPSLTVAPGALIQVRDAVWRVLCVDQASSGKGIWTVVGVSEIVRDQEAVFLEEYEPQVEVLDPRETRLVADGSGGHRASLLYVEALLRDVPPPDGAICVGHRAALDLLDFQLDPARLALAQLRRRILIADAVGLGKTLEAGILLAELVRRGRARRILVVTVKAMLTQFQKELWSRFTLPLVRLDSLGLQRIREKLPAHHNPFLHHDRVILSIDTLKQRNALRHHLEQARWDVVVIDEAHNVAERGRTASQRSQLASLLAPRCDSLILLSATPHDGRPESFASLMNMLDPTAIANPQDYTREEIRGLYVRRFKNQVQDQIRAHFPERQMRSARVEASPAEEAAYAALAALDLHTNQGQQQQQSQSRGTAPWGSMLFRTALEKALFSSPLACLQTVNTRLRNLAQRQDAGRFAGDVAQLEALAGLLQAIGKEQFSRYRKLVELVRPGGELGWSPRRKDDRLVVFTERIETLKFLTEQLPADIGLPARAVRILHGSMSDTEQQEAVEDFGKDSSPVRLLLASDVAAEGINLHYLCHRLIHFDVPWSLMVFQQRNGRIDRYGQERTPEILYLCNTSRHPKIRGDQRILDRLIEKEDRAARNIEDPRNLLGVPDVQQQEAATAQAMEQNVSPDDLERFLGLGSLDPVELLLSGDSRPPVEPAPPRPPASLFGSDFDWLVGVLDLLREQEEQPLRARSDRQQRTVELELPADLRRRFSRLPPEIFPAEGWLVLTDDRQRLQEEIKASRAEESTWPRLQYLWPLHPVLSWAADRLRGHFGRHRAPVLCLQAGLAPAEAAFLVSGLVPNRQGQPVVHRWYAAVFAGERFVRLESCATFLQRAGLGRSPVPNLGPLRLEELQQLLPRAVAETEVQVLADRSALAAELGQRLAEQRARLSLLRSRREEQLEREYAARRSARDLEERGREQRRIQEVFARMEQWVQDALTTEPQPFLQVIALACGTAWLARGGAA